MSTARVRRWLAILALALGLGAALMRTPAPGATGARASHPIYKPPSGC